MFHVINIVGQDPSLVPYPWNKNLEVFHLKRDVITVQSAFLPKVFRLGWSEKIFVLSI